MLINSIPIFKNSSVEKRLKSVSFTKHIFKKKENCFKPDLYVCIFTEFGCESLAFHYLIKDIIDNYKEYRIVLVGWNDRAFLYSELCDEFWELDEEFMWLREYSRAFSFISFNLKWIENEFKKMGNCLSTNQLGRLSLRVYCKQCKNVFFDAKKTPYCSRCGSFRIDRSLTGDPHRYKNKKCNIPKISDGVMNNAREIIKGKKTVAIFARNRKAYSRNLTIEFYDELIEKFIESGYQIIWMGESVSVSGISRPDVINLVGKKSIELTLAVLSLCEFSVQFWTASTRLSAMVGIPFLLIESPEQIVGPIGQEGLRLVLTSDPNKKKILYSNYNSFLDNISKATNVVFEAAMRLRDGNTDDELGFVDDPNVAASLITSRNLWSDE